VTDAYVPLTGPPTWQHAACRGEDPEMFFPIGDTGPALLQIEKAKAVCRRCRVIDQCRSWVDAHPKLTEHGIWAALTPEERHPVLDDAITGGS
jgi:WhiB family redox-sensing transcriptional regulator